LIGTLKGGFIFLASLVLKLDFDLEIEFISARSYGDSFESSGTVDLHKKLSVEIKNRHLLIVEDVVESGLTVKFLLEDLASAQPASSNVVTLLNKTRERKAEVPIKYVGFEIGNRFVVGFGLDYREKYRNLPYLAVFKQVNEE
jgi:hypoxanthine phosphoribosyltransferase